MSEYLAKKNVGNYLMITQAPILPVKKYGTLYDSVKRIWTHAIILFNGLKVNARRLQKCNMKINLRNRQNTSFRFDQACYRKVLWFKHILFA